MEYLVLFLPLIGSFISGFFGNILGGRKCQFLTSGLIAISGIAAPSQIVVSLE